MVSRETQHHTTLKFYKLDIKKPQLCGFCHIILFTSVKNPENEAYDINEMINLKKRVEIL